MSQFWEKLYSFRQTDRETDAKTDRQTNKQTDRQVDRQTDCIFFLALSSLIGPQMVSLAWFFFLIGGK